jgi:hypothetical protein|tara:strand:- start:3682 stop:3873 length:192 start_codon:yes stop_codon:yes gene_type:complete
MLFIDYQFTADENGILFVDRDGDTLKLEYTKLQEGDILQVEKLETTGQVFLRNVTNDQKFLNR